MKNIFFLCSLPRAGNTLLGSIINSNNNIKMTPNSLGPEILFNLVKIKQTEMFINFPKHSSIDNLIKSSLFKYYEDWNVDTIIDRSVWGTPGNLPTIQSIFNKPKFIVLLRPLLECICSFAKLEIDAKKIKKENITPFVDELMNFDKGIVGKSIWSIQNLMDNNKDNVKVFYYKDLVTNTDNFLNQLSDYIGVKIKMPKKLEQFNIDGTYYDDRNHTKNLHKINTGPMHYVEYDFEKYLTKDVIKKYKNFEKLNEHFNT